MSFLSALQEFFVLFHRLCADTLYCRVLLSDLSKTLPDATKQQVAHAAPIPSVIYSLESPCSPLSLTLATLLFTPSFWPPTILTRSLRLAHSLRFALKHSRPHQDIQRARYVTKTSVVLAEYAVEGKLSEVEKHPAVFVCLFFSDSILLICFSATDCPWCKSASFS